MNALSSFATNKVGKKDQELFIDLIVYYLFLFFHYERFFSLIAETWPRSLRKLLIHYKLYLSNIFVGAVQTSFRIYLRRPRMCEK